MLKGDEETRTYNVDLPPVSRLFHLVLFVRDPDLEEIGEGESLPELTALLSDVLQ